MDGNGRWASRQGKPRSHGHSGRQRCPAPGGRGDHAAWHPPFLPLSTPFPAKNWNRPNLEVVKQLLELFMRALTREVRELDEHDVSTPLYRRPFGVQPGITRWHASAERRTENNRRLILNVARPTMVGGAISFRPPARSPRAGSRPESWTRGRYRHRSCQPPPGTSRHACTRPVDTDRRRKATVEFSTLAIFAYTELYFTDVLWPDFFGRRCGGCGWKISPRASAASADWVKSRVLRTRVFTAVLIATIGLLALFSLPSEWFSLLAAIVLLGVGGWEAARLGGLKRCAGALGCLGLYF